MEKKLKCQCCDSDAIAAIKIDIDVPAIGFCELHAELVKAAYVELLFGSTALMERITRKTKKTKKKK